MNIESSEKKTYRIYASRHDVPEEVVARIETEKPMQAVKKFKEICRSPSHAWDDLRMERVEVVERVTTIASFYRPEGKRRREFKVRREAVGLPKAQAKKNTA
jgi:hypothetical protein